ncbi:MAG TPA: hypothetical protein VF601_09360 [Beijerinckiaceae bacterium]|jgi:hypothetical protein
MDALTRSLEKFAALLEDDKRLLEVTRTSRDAEPPRDPIQEGDAPDVHSVVPGMRPDDDPADSRARAAACRGMAETAESADEARTWLQIAAMWDGLADRAGEKPAADPAPPAAAPPAAATRAVDPEARGREDGGEGELSPLRAPHPEAAPRRRGLRRAAVLAVLLLPLLALATLWPRTDKRAVTVAEQPGTGAAAAPPQVPATAVADVMEAPAGERAAPPGEAAPIAAPAAPAEKSAAVQSPPDRVAGVPGEPAGLGANPEPAGGGPAPQPEPQGIVPNDAGPSPSNAAQPAPGDPPPSEARPGTAALGETLVGTWWPNACPKPAERRNAVPMVLGEDRARAGAASCTFLKKTPAGSAWTIVARCSDGSSSWTAHIRLVLAGKRLNWSSERGTQAYVRC